MANKKVAYTEYAVEVNNEHGFVHQIDVFSTCEQAEACCDDYDKNNLAEDEYLNIIFIDYNSDGDEVGFGTVC